ncbi:hypothetical protein CANMA_000248 [Candida margitis]|uniref:uncharacterized protein n=1 Tax=Candida margitis TaxID=1775924 RepID=UPI002227D928|nr:uncharacterized protein CANMA_000248 [Candida margitis]KAI5970657.1 hypothetical protein CANMA_000248 [Candida margitis]
MSLRHVTKYDLDDDHINSVNGNGVYLEENNPSDDSSDISSDEGEDDNTKLTAIINNPIANQNESEDDMFSSEDDKEPTRKPQLQLHQDDDDDDDMFASDNDNEIESTNEAKKVQFSNNNQTIHLSSQSSDNSNNNDESQSEPEEEDEDRNDYYINAEEFTTSQQGKKRQQPKIEAFNMDQEEREGHFNKLGDYVSNKHSGTDSDESQDEDAWTTQFTKSDIRKAKLAQAKRQQDADESSSGRSINLDPIESVLASLIEALEPVETPMEALARLNTQLKSTKKSKKSQKPKDKKQLDSSIAKQSVSQITNFCSILVKNETKLHFDNDVYDMTREEFMRKYQTLTGHEYKRSAARGSGLKRPRDDEVPDTSGKQQEDQYSELQEEQDPLEDEVDYGEKIWEFKWLNDDANTINGPYSQYEMKHWKQNYFENGVEVRKVGESAFRHIQDITF